MTKFEEPMIKVVRFATPEILTISIGFGLDDTDVPSAPGYNDSKDTYGDLGDNPFGV